MEIKIKSIGQSDSLEIDMDKSKNFYSKPRDNDC